MTCFLLFFHSVLLLAFSFQFCLYPIFLTGTRSLIWPGGDLLSHALRRSTIGAEDFHGRVRDGIGCGPLAIATRPGERTVTTGDQRLSARGLNAFCRRANTVTKGNRCLSACKAIKPIERLVLVSFTCCHASTPSLSTWWSSTGLKRDLVLRGASRLDAFSGYPFRT